MPNPIAEATPAINVTAISVVEKCHDWTYTHLNTSSQTIIMAASQIIKQGRGDHFANSLPRNPSTIGTQRGSVYNTLRSIPCLNAPAT
jgi:hypothetical protein